MHWSRAKNVLIYAFLLLNLVLGYQLWLDKRDQASANLDLTSLTETTQRSMEEKQIQVRARIPAETPALPKINYRLLKPGNSEPVKLVEPVDSRLIFNSKGLVSALESQIPQIGSYRYDQESSMDSVFILHPLALEEWPLFNINLELNYSNQKVMSYRMESIEVVQMDEEKVQQVLPASKALGFLIDKFLPPKTIVTDIELGYYGQVFNSDAQVAAPAWRFTLGSGEKYYVLGSGDVISPEAEKPKE